MTLEAGYRQTPDWPTWFRHIADEHAAMIRMYCHAVDDVPYFYTERANAGLLGSAAWKAGFMALEEYNCEKTGDNGPTRGRADLWIYSAEANTDLSIECKPGWIGPDSSAADLERPIQAAVADAKRAPKSRIHAGCVFFIPGYPKTTPDLAHEVAKTLERVLARPHDCVFWSFPSASRDRPGNGKYSNTIYPGIISLLRRVPDSEP